MAMNELNKNGMNVYLAFHVNEDLDANKATEALKKSMREVFGAQQSLEFSSEERMKREFVYKVQQPLIISDLAIKDFFEKLQEIFNLNHALNPHFTQVSSEIKRSKK